MKLLPRSLMVHGGAWWDIVTWRCMVTYGGARSLIPTWKRVVDQPGLHSEFQANQAYIVKPCLKNKRKEVLIITKKKKKSELNLASSGSKFRAPR